MILICIETSVSLLTEISSIELAIELNFSFCSDSIDSFCDKTVKWDLYSICTYFNYYASLNGWMKIFITYK